MELVVDANVLVAGFLRSATSRELLLDERLVLWAPEYSLTEAERVLTSPRLRRRLGGLSVADVQSLLTQVTAKIRILPAASNQHCLGKAHRLAPHAADVPYLALAVHLNIPVWSNDFALKQQQAVRVYTTQEPIEFLQRHSR